MVGTNTIHMLQKGQLRYREIEGLSQGPLVSEWQKPQQPTARIIPLTSTLNCDVSSFFY